MDLDIDKMTPQEREALILQLLPKVVGSVGPNPDGIVLAPVCSVEKFAPGESHSVVCQSMRRCRPRRLVILEPVVEENRIERRERWDTVELKEKRWFRTRTREERVPLSATAPSS